MWRTFRVTSDNTYLPPNTSNNNNNKNNTNQQQVLNEVSEETPLTKKHVQPPPTEPIPAKTDLNLSPPYSNNNSISSSWWPWSSQPPPNTTLPSQQPPPISSEPLDRIDSSLDQQNSPNENSLPSTTPSSWWFWRSSESTAVPTFNSSPSERNLEISDLQPNQPHTPTQTQILSDPTESTPLLANDLHDSVPQLPNSSKEEHGESNISALLWRLNRIFAILFSSFCTPSNVPSDQDFHSSDNQPFPMPPESPQTVAIQANSSTLQKKDISSLISSTSTTHLNSISSNSSTQRPTSESLGLSEVRLVDEAPNSKSNSPRKSYWYPFYGRKEESSPTETLPVASTSLLDKDKSQQQIPELISSTVSLPNPSTSVPKNDTSRKIGKSVEHSISTPNLKKSSISLKTETSLPSSARSMTDGDSKAKVKQSDESSPKALIKKPKRPNVIVPIYQSQKESSTLLNKALFTVQSLFSLPSKLPPTVQPMNVKTVVVIGIHGWYPTKLVQKVIGEPTGTSNKFCEMMTQAVLENFEHTFGYPLSPDKIHQIPLVGEGKVQDRVDLFYKHLHHPDNTYIPLLKNSSLVYFATHSQGTPVTFMLMEKLIGENILQPYQQRVCMLAMAGITHGPFPSLKQTLYVQYIEKAAARELFSFCDESSQISQQLTQAIHVALLSGVRVLAVASWYDQVVPLYSAVMHGIHHPSLHRVVFIEGNDYSHDFLSHLVAFTLKLRNYGFHDNDLVMHLSEVVAGSLYGGTQGHSTLYEEIQVFRFAVDWSFDSQLANATYSPPSQLQTATTHKSSQQLRPIPFSSNMADIIKTFSPHHPTAPLFYSVPSVSAQPLNPYFLPWIMNSLLSDERILRHPSLAIDLQDLKDHFLTWEPTSKVMKELKYRLEPLRAKL